MASASGLVPVLQILDFCPALLHHHSFVGIRRHTVRALVAAPHLQILARLLSVELKC